MGSSLKLLPVQRRGMAPPFSLRLPPRTNPGTAIEVHGGLSCEIVSDLCPNPLSHDWHVQPSCQRPNRDPPERREFSPGEFVSRLEALAGRSARPTLNPTVLETFQPYRSRQTLSTHATHRISTRFPHWESGLGWAAGELKAQPKAGSSPGFQPDSE